MLLKTLALVNFFRVRSGLKRPETGGPESAF